MDINRKFEPTTEDFLFIEQNLIDWDFKKMTKADSSDTFRRLELSPPREIIGREAGFEYTNTENNYSVVVWTTYLETEGKWRDVGTDVCWVLIKEGDKEKYFAKPIARIKGFVLKLLRYAWVTKWKIDHRPKCDQCNLYMEINRKPGSRQYYWICNNSTEHLGLKPKFKSWDVNLPTKARSFVAIGRDLTAEYKERLKKVGKVTTPAAVIRKRWKRGNSEISK